ncbi:MAG: SRPBCC domain-containing protein [Bacteroidetes bacterium]|nr:SRPBCC domain-containing protein [Bacteroidota bacterium]
MNNLLFDFTVDKTAKTVFVTREFAADLSLVWDAFTTSEIIDQWWAPRPWKTKTKSMDFREGGHWHYAMVGPAGEEHWCWADYIYIDVQKKYTGSDAFADAEGNINKELPQSSWEVNFAALGENTLVTYGITFPDLAQLEATIKMGFKEGMTMALENLDELLLRLSHS